MFRVQLQKHPTAHLFFCIQSVALSQGRPENCPQPLFLEVSGPGPPLFPGQQVCLIHQQHIYLMLWHFLYVQLLEAHNRHIFTKQNKSKMWAFQQPAFTSGLELALPPPNSNECNSSFPPKCTHQVRTSEQQRISGINNLNDDITTDKHENSFALSITQGERTPH